MPQSRYGRLMRLSRGNFFQPLVGLKVCVTSNLYQD